MNDCVSFALTVLMLVLVGALVVIMLSHIMNDPPAPEVQLQECLSGCIDEYDVGTEGHRLCTEGCMRAYEEMTE